MATYAGKAGSLFAAFEPNSEKKASRQGLALGWCLRCAGFILRNSLIARLERMRANG
jgi:hypothetical protein